MANNLQHFTGDADETLPVAAGLGAMPALVLSAGEHGTYRFVGFFAAHLRNPNTRAAYFRDVCAFFRWCQRRQIRALSEIRSHHVAGYVERLGTTHAPPSVKQHLAAIRMLFDWLVIRQIVAHNPASAVRGPTYVVHTGKTPVLLGEEARVLLDSITTDTLMGLRDRALIALLVYTLARVSAAMQMNGEDVYVQGKRLWVRLHEKGGKEHTLPCHHELEGTLDAYRDAIGIGHEKGTPLFRSAMRRSVRLTDTRLHRIDAFRMVKRRARAAGILAPIGCHTFRATGITQYLLHGGTLEHAQHMAVHESSRTTGLYDRRKDEITLDEVERIILT